MNNIIIDPKRLGAIKDEVFARRVASETPYAVREVLKDEALQSISRVVADPQILTEVDANGDVWVGNEYIRVKVHLQSFIKAVEIAIAAEL